MSAHRLDRGMAAVERVRGVRERDSRLGLVQARAEQDRHATRLRDLAEQIAAAPAFGSGSSASFLAERGRVTALGDAARSARADAEAATRLTEVARGHWVRDRTRLAAVELLLERRAAARRAERDRLEARELDDVAGRLWARTRGGVR